MCIRDRPLVVLVPETLFFKLMFLGELDADAEPASTEVVSLPVLILFPASSGFPVPESTSSEESAFQRESPPLTDAALPLIALFDKPVETLIYKSKENSKDRLYLKRFTPQNPSVQETCTLKLPNLVT